MHANDLPICEGRDFEMARVKKGFRTFFFLRSTPCAMRQRGRQMRRFPQFSVNLEIPGTVAQRGLVLKRFRTFFFRFLRCTRRQCFSPNATSFPNFRSIIDPWHHRPDDILIR